MTNDSNIPTFMLPKDLNEYIEKEEKAGRDPFASKTTSPTPENQPSERAKSKEQVATSPAPPKPKNLANKHAVKHGGYCPGLLPWESREEFEALLTSLKEDWKPVGIMQGEAVVTLCQWMWTRRRVTQGSEIKYFRSPVTEALKTGELTWDDVVQHEASVPARVDTFISSQIELAEKLSAVCENIAQQPYSTSTPEGKERQLELMRMQQEIHALACSVKETVLGQDIRKTINQITGLFDQAYQPEEIEKQATLLCMVDREIDRAIKRLIYLKTFWEEPAHRKIPMLESPPVTPPQSSESDHSPKPAAKNIKTETD